MAVNKVVLGSETLLDLTGDTVTKDTPKMDLPARILPPTRLASPLMVCVPDKYCPAAMTWSVLFGV